MEEPEILTNPVAPEHKDADWAEAVTFLLPAVDNQQQEPGWLADDAALDRSNSPHIPQSPINRRISLTPLPETLLSVLEAPVSLEEEKRSELSLSDLPTGMWPLHVDAFTARILLELQGPSLGLWRAAEIAALCEQTFERPILDVGCGDGLVTSMALSVVDVGLDPDAHTLERTARLGLYEQFECVPVEEARLEEESFATVVSNSVLEHLPHVDEALAAIARMLLPGGKLILTAPTESFSKWLALPIEKYAAWRNRRLCHLNLWSIEEWRQHLEKAGFEVELVRPYMRRELVMLWDALELLQQLYIGHYRLFSLLWRRLPHRLLDWLAQQLTRLDLSAKAPGGGRLIVARKRP
ncbi:MAG TPA: class I SAM-dependent methyltransferase [Ktedonobacteraceae bacterium]|nr:class I SAM-dependent methyltransferase [Ktedonobacteraceae bacterium]